MPKSITWYGIIAISLVSFVFMIFGFVQAVRFTSGLVKEAAPPISQAVTTNNIGLKNPNNINVLIIGDSIAKGTGDEKFKGIGSYLPELMKNQTPKDIVVDNAGIDGYKSSDLVQLIKSGKLDNALETADIVLISIGGNDLREIQSLKDVAKEAAYKEKQEIYVSGLKETTQRIRALNKNAVVVFIGLYDPYAADNSNENARLISNWNYETQLIIAEDEKAVFIPTYDLFKFNLDRFIAGDKLHPNTTGYQMISYLISKDIENAVSKL